MILAGPLKAGSPCQPIEFPSRSDGVNKHLEFQAFFIASLTRRSTLRGPWIPALKGRAKITATLRVAR